MFWGCETTLSYRTHIPILGGKSPLSNASQDNVLDSWQVRIDLLYLPRSTTNVPPITILGLLWEQINTWI